MLQKRELTGMAKQFYDVAEEIRKSGWCQGHAEDSKGAVCIQGAAARVNCFNGVFFREFMRETGLAPAQWNDHPGRTKREVIDKLEAIAWRLADEAFYRAGD